jgi:hypothetical protein
MEIPQPISCFISMKNEILVDRAEPGADAAYQPAHGFHGHHAPLDRARAIEPATMTIAFA